jgi:hypothetical protein
VAGTANTSKGGALWQRGPTTGTLHNEHCGPELNVKSVVLS